MIYFGVLFVLVPSEIYLSKPILGSLGDLYDSAMYKSMIYYNTEGVMGSVLASGHAYWEFGYIGLLIYPYFYVLILHLLSSARLPFFPYLNVFIALILIGGLITDGFSTLFIPVYAINDMFIKSCLPILIFYYFYNRVFYSK